MVNELLEDIFYMQLGTGSKKKNKKKQYRIEYDKMLKNMERTYADTHSAKRKSMAPCSNTAILIS